MATQVRDLRDRAEVWLATPTEQPNGETDYCYTKVKTIWAAVNPTSGRTETLTGDAERAEHDAAARDAQFRLGLRAPRGLPERQPAGAVPRDVLYYPRSAAGCVVLAADL